MLVVGPTQELLNLGGPPVRVTSGRQETALRQHTRQGRVAWPLSLRTANDRFAKASRREELVLFHVAEQAADAGFRELLALIRQVAFFVQDIGNTFVGRSSVAQFTHPLFGFLIRMIALIHWLACMPAFSDFQIVDQAFSPTLTLGRCDFVRIEYISDLDEAMT